MNCDRSGDNRRMFQEAQERKYVHATIRDWSVSKNGLGRPQNDLGGCWDQAYHFQHQKLPRVSLQEATPTAKSPMGMMAPSASIPPQPPTSTVLVKNALWFQSLPYAPSREPFHTGHGRPFRTNTQANTNKQIPLCFIYIL